MPSSTAASSHPFLPLSIPVLFSTLPSSPFHCLPHPSTLAFPHTPAPLLFFSPLSSAPQFECFVSVQWLSIQPAKAYLCVSVWCLWVCACLSMCVRAYLHVWVLREVNISIFRKCLFCWFLLLLFWDWLFQWTGTLWVDYTTGFPGPTGLSDSDFSTVTETLYYYYYKKKKTCFCCCFVWFYVGCRVKLNRVLKLGKKAFNQLSCFSRPCLGTSSRTSQVAMAVPQEFSSIIRELEHSSSPQRLMSNAQDFPLLSAPLHMVFWLQWHLLCSFSSHPREIPHSPELLQGQD